MQAKNVLTRTRELYAIPGDDCNDCLCAFFCMTCSMCRVYRHVNDYHGADADKTVCCDCSATLDAPHPPTPAWAVQRPGVVAVQPGTYAAQPPPIQAPPPYEIPDRQRTSNHLVYATSTCTLNARCQMPSKPAMPLPTYAKVCSLLSQTRTHAH